MQYGGLYIQGVSSLKVQSTMIFFYFLGFTRKFYRLALIRVLVINIILKTYIQKLELKGEEARKYVKFPHFTVSLLNKIILA